MSDSPYIAEAASLIGDPARANMLIALLDGRARTVTELALAARVAQSTTSGHLAKLLEGRLVSVTSSGRHRYYRLASPAVGDVLESLMAFAVDGPPRHRPRSPCSEPMARARTCYDHLAGKLGVGLAQSLEDRGLVHLTEDGGIITDCGRMMLDDLGIEIESQKRTRPLCRACLDWSERRWHLGGAVGAALATRCFELGWTERQPESRAVTVTVPGAKAFKEIFGVSI